jgi:hypothetical protein
MRLSLSRLAMQFTGAETDFSSNSIVREWWAAPVNVSSALWLCARAAGRSLPLRSTHVRSIKRRVP